VKNQPDYHRRTPFSASTFLPRTVHSVTEVRRGLTPGQEQPSSAREQLESVYGDAKLEAVTCRSLHRRSKIRFEAGCRYPGEAMNAALGIVENLLFLVM
jgi:hypothetical protein